MADVVHAFVVVSVPKTDVLLKGFANFQRNEVPLTVDFTVMPTAIPGTAFEAPMQITGLQRMYFPLTNGNSRPTDPKGTTIPVVEYVVWANIKLPDHVSDLFQGRTLVRVKGEIYPEVYPDSGRGWLDEDL